jgi:hypothetical protein
VYTLQSSQKEEAFCQAGRCSRGLG